MGPIAGHVLARVINDKLLDHDEALFVINLARSLMRYLDAKVSK